MKKGFVLLFTLCSVLGSHAQQMEGKYVGTELIPHRVDNFGKAHFYPRQDDGAHTWFFDVTVTIVDNRISVAKRYVSVDGRGRKDSADANVSTFNYVGVLTPVGDRYMARTKLTGRPALFPYDQKGSLKGKILKIEDIKPSRKEEAHTYQFFKYTDGEHWVFKEMVQQDFIIRPDKGGLWINNQFFKQIE